MNTPRLHPTEPVPPDAAHIVQRLDQGLENLDATTRDALYTSRRQAMSHWTARSEASPVARGLLALQQHPLAGLMGLAVLLLAGLWLAIHPMTDSPFVPALTAAETGALDIELLTGPLPPQVFVDWSLVNQEQVQDVCVRDWQ